MKYYREIALALTIMVIASATFDAYGFQKDKKQGQPTRIVPVQQRAVVEFMSSASFIASRGESSFRKGDIVAFIRREKGAIMVVGRGVILEAFKTECRGSVTALREGADELEALGCEVYVTSRDNSPSSFSRLQF